MGLSVPQCVESSQSGIKPTSSALAGGFLSTGSPEKSCISGLKRRSTPSAVSVLSQWLTPYSFSFSLLSFCELLFWRSWSPQSGNQSCYVVSSLPQLLHGTDASDHPSLPETHSPCLCDEVFLLILLLIHPCPFSHFPNLSSLPVWVNSVWYPRTRISDVNNKNLFLKVLEAEKSSIKVPVDVFPGEDSLSACRPLFSCCLVTWAHWACLRYYKANNPIRVHPLNLSYY